MILNQEWIDAHISGPDAFLFVDTTKPKADAETEAQPEAEADQASPSFS